MWPLWGFDWQDHLLTDVVKDSYIWWRERERRSLRHEGFPCSSSTWDDHEFWEMRLTMVFSLFFYIGKHLFSILSCALSTATRTQMYAAFFLKSSALKTIGGFSISTKCSEMKNLCVWHYKIEYGSCWTWTAGMNISGRFIESIYKWYICILSFKYNPQYESKKQLM